MPVQPLARSGRLSALKNSDAGTRTRVAWVKARYPNQLDYIGSASRHVMYFGNDTVSIVLHSEGPEESGPTATGFEPVRAKPIGFQVRLLNLSDTLPDNLNWCQDINMDVVGAEEK